MRSINVILAVVISLCCGLLAFEVGLRFLGRGPQATINQFDPVTGWSKKPGATSRRETAEFDVRYEINSLGLRDSDNTSYAKPAGTYRVLCLGDSFTLGYTVDEHDLFAAQRVAVQHHRPFEVHRGAVVGAQRDDVVDECFRRLGQFQKLHIIRADFRVVIRQHLER